MACPDCIRDVTTENRSALHIAAETKRLDVLQILIRMLKKKDYYQEEILKLLLSSKADNHATNQSDLTALDVTEQHNYRESISILRGNVIPGVSNIKSKWKKQIVKHVGKASSIVFEDLDNITSDKRNALLVVLGLLLTGTYQATLSPPGGVWQGDSKSWPKRS
ncbi:hypothetical protein CXB51_025080 [Gossypium anomalum]|uniref:PGG domain-containing protein n=1 Tax=Gossypium anomalum TaxID=47600 RepID=A0A8J6CS34_9ROSI|nr:hypothetical protein CXB51_025080 [Gossypium anomalum]